MNLQRPHSTPRGFTLVELLVAMSITTVIVAVLVSITSVAMETWNRSRSELRASRQAQTMVDSLANDLSALVIRRGNTNEWLFAKSNPPPSPAPAIPNAAKLIFFTAATDRYNGNTPNSGGDISCVNYTLSYRDPINSGAVEYPTFVLNRYLVDPDQCFTKLLGVTRDRSTSSSNSLEDVFTASYSEATTQQAGYFACENVLQFTVTFHVEVNTGTSSAITLVDVPVTISQNGSTNVTNQLVISGSMIDTQANCNGVTSDQLKAGRVTSAEIALTVLSDLGIDMLRNRPSLINDTKFLAKNSYQYCKRVEIPGM